MSENPVDWKEEQRLAFADADADEITYDYFKSMTSLSIGTLGGVLTLSESVFAEAISTNGMMLAGLLVAGSGVVALQCVSDIVQIRRGKKSHSVWLRYGDRLAPALLGMGIGAFLSLLGLSFSGG